MIHGTELVSRCLPSKMYCKYVKVVFCGAHIPTSRMHAKSELSTVSIVKLLQLYVTLVVEVPFL